MGCIRLISIETLKAGIWWEANSLTISHRTARGCLGDSQTGIIKSTNSPCLLLKTTWVDTITRSRSSNTSLKLQMKITVPTKEWILYSIMKDMMREMTSLLLISRKISLIIIPIKLEWNSEGDKWQKWEAAAHH